jgi:hypothetical protein
MVEIHLECPKCRNNIVAKLQSEVYEGERRARVRLPPPRTPHPMLQRFGEWGATVTVTLNDGSQRNVTSYEELLAVLLRLHRPVSRIHRHPDQYGNIRCRTTG